MFALSHHDHLVAYRIHVATYLRSRAMAEGVRWVRRNNTISSKLISVCPSANSLPTKKTEIVINIGDIRCVCICICIHIYIYIYIYRIYNYMIIVWPITMEG